MKTATAFIIIVIIGLGLLIYSHEEVHQEIYRSYGINSTMHFLTLQPYTQADKPCPNSECELAHNINESIGYHIIPLYFIVGVGLFFIIFELNYANKLKEKQ